MSVNDAIKQLITLEEKRQEKVFSSDTLCVGCARLGSDNPHIKSGSTSALINHDFGDPLHCLIIPGQLHYMEEEALILYR
jgi:diphthine synthase